MVYCEKSPRPPDERHLLWGVGPRIFVTASLLGLPADDCSRLVG